MEKVAKERMTSMDADNALPQVILSVKPVSAAIKSFFGSSQLSQFMDQTNPLSELTSKRRLSALGPGGLSRQSAKLEVRDVHHSHYGRICPIETPEGPNIGLIGSMAIHARVDDFGFLQTPYRRVKKGVVTNEIVYMTADEDHNYHIAPGNEPLDEHGRFKRPLLQVRYQDSYPIVKPEEVEFMDVSPMQIVSVATAMIPFLENDDAIGPSWARTCNAQRCPRFGLRPLL
jgi:DNA-directed RNA polymerase subunit beta (EC 2.7.7.6)